MSSGVGDDAGLFLNTSIGRLHVIDEENTYDEAVEYCADRGDQLASLRNQTVINQVITQLEDSNATSTSGYFFNFFKWSVGLKLNNGKGQWSDGTVYDSIRDSKLFSKTANLTGCKVPLWHRNPELGTANCDKKFHFFCLDSSDNENVDNNLETTTFHQNAAVTSQNQYLLIVFGIIALFVVFLLACLVIMWRRRKKNTKRTVTNPVYDTSLPVESPPPRLIRVLSNDELDHDYASINLNLTPRLDRHVYGEISDDRGLSSSSDEEEDDSNNVGSVADAKYSSVYLQAF